MIYKTVTKLDRKKGILKMTKTSPKNESILYNFPVAFQKEKENIWTFSRCKIDTNKKMTGRLFSLYFKRHIDDISSILSVKTARLLLKLLEIKRDIFLLCYAWCLESENLDKILKRGKMVWMKAWFDLIFSFFLFPTIKRFFSVFRKFWACRSHFWLNEWGGSLV